MLRAMIRNRKAVNLFLNCGNKGKRLTFGIDRYLAAVICNGSGSVLIILNHAVNGDIISECSDNRQNRVDLSLSAVEKN